jgi:hypothetical protein
MALASFGPLSFFRAFFFPRHGRRIYRQSVHFDGVTRADVEAWWADYRYFLKKVQCAQPERRLVLKNPANSARVTALRTRFPGAKFIHIHRHPEEVFASTLHTHRKLQEAWALQADDPVQLSQTVLANQADLTRALIEQTLDIPDNNFVNIRMSDLETAPLPTLRQIYARLQIPGFESAVPYFTEHLDRIGDYTKNHFQLTPAERDAVREMLAHQYQRWGYD